MRRVALANRCYLGLNRQLKSKELCRATKLQLYKVLILSVLLYRAALVVRVRVSDDCRIRTNRERYDLFNDMDVANRINIQRFRWLGHVVRVLTSLGVTDWRRQA